LLYKMKVVSLVALASLGVGAAASGAAEPSLRAQHEVSELALADNGKWTACWKDAHGRGVGRVVHTCRAGTEQSGLLCYPPCEQQFAGVGPVCWERCPAGATDGGVFCRAAGKVHTKKSYGRGVGEVLRCGADEQQDLTFFGLCYPACRSREDGVGPVCWSQCKGSLPYDGGALCCKDKETCKQDIVDMALKLPTALAKAVLDSKDIAAEIKDIKSIIEDALGFVLPLCSEVHGDM
jgi:hypothetical protein